ncbi:MAG: ABC transporter substrate-binding protein [Rhodospirillaceae bacterium]|nr:ABC transporter substrate-binding protein [Rhodospirillaceae bacterium]
MKYILRCIVVVAALQSSPVAACELDRPIVFAGLDWDSVGFHNAVARAILEKGYGCRTDVIPGTTIPLIQGAAQGQIDIVMEIWKDAVTEVWQRALARGQVVEVGVNFPDAVQGWYVPRYLVEGDAAPAPDLKSVSDLVRYKDLFRDPEEPGKGRFYNCAAGWACEIVNSNKLVAYGLTAHFTNFRPGTGTALAAAIAGAYKQVEPILAYYWGPTWVMGAHDLVKLAEPAWNETDWRGIAASADYPRPVDFPVVEVWIGANAGFAAAAPEVMGFLSKYRTSAALVSAALAHMRETGADDAAAATWFLKTYPEVWTAWLNDDIALRVQASLR